MAYLKNLFTGSWSFGSLRNDGVWIPAYDQENPTNNVGCTEFIQIDASKPATFSWAGWSTLIPSDVTIHSYHSATDSTSYAKVVIDRLSQTVVNNSITFENADGADFIRLYFHGAGSARQYIPIGFQITQAGVFDDVAFKVIVKNDGISDVIFKTLMLKGEAGGTISSIEKTSSSGNVDTYTITLNDGTTTTFEVTNGSNIESIEKTATSGLIDTYTVTLTNGDTTTFEVKNGEDAQLYELPQDCIVAYDKEPEYLHEVAYSNYLALDDVDGIDNITVDGFIHQVTTAGKNLLPYPYANSTTTFNDVYYTDNGDGSIKCNGTANGGTSYFNFQRYKSAIGIDQVGTYTLSRTILSGSGTFTIQATVRDSNGDVKSRERVNNNTASKTFTLETGDYVADCFLYIEEGNSASDLVLAPQIEAGSQATSYEEYTGKAPSPSPDYPQPIVGMGEKQLDGTYSVTIEVVDSDDNSYYLTASGLSAPVFSWDTIDFKQGIVHRGWGYKVLDGSEEGWYAYTSGNGYAITIDDMMSGTRQNGKCNSFLVKTAVSSDDNIINFGLNTNHNIYFVNVNITGVTDLASWKTWLSNNETYIVYPLDSAIDESVTITGDIDHIKNMRDWVVEIKAPQYASPINAWYYGEIDFPDGYEEVGLPIDDLLYYQDQEYIEFPTNWGFAMGYVFDADEVRFMINVTKDLHDGFRVVANRSLNLALSIYTGSGGGSLTGFNLVDASFIREYGQIQLRLQTETAHGLTVGSLLGARVSQGRLRITFEED